MKGLIGLLFAFLPAVSFAYITRNATVRSMLACQIKDRRLQNHIITSASGDTSLDCGHLCLREANCVSFNWKSTGKLCETSSSDKNTNAADFIAAADFTYWGPDGCSGFTTTTTTTPVPTPPPFQCVSPNLLVQNKCFFAEKTQTKTWNNADTFCKARAPAGKWSLATFEAGEAYQTNVLNSALFDATADKDKDFWVGLHDDSGTWKWSDPSNTPLGTPDPKMWHLSQTAASGPTCAYLSYKKSGIFSGLQRNRGCTSVSMHYICVKQS